MTTPQSVEKILEYAGSVLMNDTPLVIPYPWYMKWPNGYQSYKSIKHRNQRQFREIRRRMNNKVTA